MSDVPVPVHKFAEVRCPRCRTVHDAVGYFDLSERLLEWLRYIDPDRGGTERVCANVDRKMRLRDEGRDREMSNYIEAVGKEHFNRMFQIQSVGYTGREKSWDR